VVLSAFPGQSLDPGTVLCHTARCLRRVFWTGALATHAGLPPLRIGVVLARGPVATGLLGGQRRCHLATLGNTVNTAARLEGLTKDLPSAAAIERGVLGGEGPDGWSRPELVNYSPRDLGPRKKKNMREPAHILGLDPLMRYLVDFVPMGLAAAPEPGVVYLDTGNAAVPGIIDTHGPGTTARSCYELLVREPDLLLAHLRGVDACRQDSTQPDEDARESVQARDMPEPSVRFDSRRLHSF